MSAKRSDFASMVDMAMMDPNRRGLRPVIEKELLHYDILFALDRSGLLGDLVFQGGTALRLCYGSSRFSEDLDFVGKKEFSTKSLDRMAEVLTDHLGDRYGLEVSVKCPKETKDLPDYQGLNVDRWQISIVTSPGRRDLPRQRIKLEVVNIESYDSELVPLQRNYDFLPSGYEDMLLKVESRGEIMADKLLSFPATLESHPRHRDLWDLQWLSQRGIAPRTDLILKKTGDYRTVDYRGKLFDAIDQLDDVIRSVSFRDEMVRFLPQDRVKATFGRDGFLDYMSSNLRSLFNQVTVDLGFASDRLPDDTDFSM